MIRDLRDVAILVLVVLVVVTLGLVALGLYEQERAPRYHPPEQELLDLPAPPPSQEVDE